ncbi:MAG: hypothetical protein AABX23_02570 [Nanoarchaeota archaeon]
MKKNNMLGIIGLLLLIFSQINVFLDIQPFERFHFIIIWIGYILFADYLVFKIKGKSWINNSSLAIIGMFIISMPFWKIFEYINIRVHNWEYIGLEYFGAYHDLFAVLAFSTVIPAFFITLSFFTKDFSSSLPKNKMSKGAFVFTILSGILMFIGMTLLPKYLFALEWIFIFLIIDGINFRNKKESVLYMFKTKQWKLINQIIFSSLIMGFLWEFWNYWATVKWIYIIPFFDFAYIFEMPILGYIGYIPFGFSIFAYYHFIKSAFSKN